jgi:hypothetical protein
MEYLSLDCATDQSGREYLSLDTGVGGFNGLIEQLFRENYMTNIQVLTIFRKLSNFQANFDYFKDLESPFAHSDQNEPSSENPVQACTLRKRINYILLMTLL